MSITKTYQALGLMSGSSLDGLDVVHCSMEITREPVVISWKLLVGETLPFSDLWTRRLANLPSQSAMSFAQTNVYFSYYMAELVKDFTKRHNIQPDFIASHGHTIFHYPDKRFTTQIGDGGALAAATGFPVVCNFRTQDIALNGEGTPLAPAADRYLFPGYDFYLNLGGIANITANINGKYIAFDTAPANQIFNALAQLSGADYDKGGTLAASGSILPNLAEALSENDYYKKPYPKSLDNQWIRQQVLPLYYEYPGSIEDRMCTAIHQLVDETIRAIKTILQKEAFNKQGYRMLVTGGGAFNLFLMKILKEKAARELNIEIVIPENKIIEFKEAILMVLLGALRLEHLPNCFASVTGAKRDTVGGGVFL